MEIALIQSLIQTFGPVGALIGIWFVYWTNRKNGKNHDLNNPSNHDLLRKAVDSLGRIEEHTSKLPSIQETVQRQHGYIHLLEGCYTSLRADVERNEATSKLEREAITKSVDDVTNSIDALGNELRRGR